MSTALAAGSMKVPMTDLQAEFAIRQLAKLRGIRPPGINAPRANRTFNGASTSRLFQDWATTDISNDSHLRNKLVPLRVRARDLCRNDDYAKKFLNVAVLNIVGPNGVGLQMDVCQSDGTTDQGACDAIEEAWAEFSKKENFTVTGRLSRPQAEAQTLKSKIRDGEYIVRKVRGFKHNKFNYAVQLIEADHLDEQLNREFPDGSCIRMGVEFDIWKRPAAYWLRSKYDGDLFGGAVGSRHYRIPAKEIVHGFLNDYVDQSRGYTWYHSAMTRLRQLGSYEEAAVIAARVAASKMAFFKRLPNALGEYTGDDTDAQGNKISEVEPGIMDELPNGMDVTTVDWRYPNTEHGQFCKAVLRGVSAGLLISYNSLANDLEGVNYSSIRAGLLEERDMWTLHQNAYIDEFEADIFSDWLDWCLLMGKINLPYDQIAKFNKPIFIGRRWSWVDPEKDMQAAKLAIELKVKTRGDIISEMTGEGIEDVCRRIQREKKIAEKYGVNLEDAIGAGAQAGGELRALIDAYGVAVRSGAITPTEEDEAFFRKMGKLPKVNKPIKDAWEKDGKVRRPITLKSQDAFEAEQKAIEEETNKAAAAPEGEK